MPVYNPGTSSGTSSGTLDTTAPRTWTGAQTFLNYIVVNGVKIRPVIAMAGTDTTVSWQFEVNGTWVEATSRVNPVPSL